MWEAAPHALAARHLLVRLRRGQAICRLAQLARLLIRSNAGLGERDKKAFPPSRVASCVWSTDAVRVCTRGGVYGLLLGTGRKPEESVC